MSQETPPTMTLQMAEYQRLSDLTSSMIGEIFTILDAAYGVQTSSSTFNGTSTGTVNYVKSKDEAIKDLIKQAMWRRTEEYGKRHLGMVELN